MSSGDSETFMLLYLQTVEGYRMDVAVVDVNLLNTTWFPDYLLDDKVVAFDLPKESLDTISPYRTWSDSMITINHFSWLVKPSYYKAYLLRGDFIFLSFLKANEFKRDVFFAAPSNPATQLNLTDYLKSMIVIEKLNRYDNLPITNKEYAVAVEKPLSYIKMANKNSQQELNMIDNIRYDVLNRIRYDFNKGDINEAQQLLKMMDKYINHKKYPYQIAAGETTDAMIRNYLKEYSHS